MQTLPYHCVALAPGLCTQGRRLFLILLDCNAINHNVMVFAKAHHYFSHIFEQIMIEKVKEYHVPQLLYVLYTVS
jgi:hypothetical protein